MNADEQTANGVWIPGSVWQNRELTALDKIIFAEIDFLDNGELGCHASNEHLASFCGCSERKVTEAVSKLQTMGFISSKYNGRQRLLKSKVAKSAMVADSARQSSKICGAGSQNLRGCIHIGEKENRNNIYIVEIVEYLNEKTGKNFRAAAERTQKHINARLQEGYTVDDFKTVIENKVSEWKGTSMEQYLRPETLFGTKFESYLYQNCAKTAKNEFDEIDFGETNL